MNSRIAELKDKQVVSVKDGSVIGFVTDLEFDIQNGKITAIVVFSKSAGMGFLNRNLESVIPWESIEIIGNDSILVNFEVLKQPPKRKQGILSSILYGE